MDGWKWKNSESRVGIVKNKLRFAFSPQTLDLQMPQVNSLAHIEHSKAWRRPPRLNEAAEVQEAASTLEWWQPLQRMQDIWKRLGSV